MSLFAAALCCSAPALAQDRSSTGFTAGIAAPGLTLSSSGAGELAGTGGSESPHVTFGRDQDIVGIPVSVLRPGKAGTVLGGRTSMRMPGIAVLPSRLPLAGATLTSRFGLRRHPLYGDLRSHSGVDLAAPTGTPVYAASAGYVGSAGWSGGYGLMIAIDHPGGMETRYGHLSRLAVGSGQYVTAGTLIGYVGSTGDSTGPHLHYEIRINGQPIDPLGR
ncbi:MAG: M23 family metallopeptidase [Novosphingobium sp.]